MFQRKTSKKDVSEEVVSPESSQQRLGLGSRTLEEQKALLKLQLRKDQERSTIRVEGGGLGDRLRLLEEQRSKDAEKNKRSYTTDASQATDELIRDRVKWLQQQRSDGNVKKEIVHVEGGGLVDRLRLFEEQKKRDAEKLKNHTTDELDVTQDLIRDRLKDLEEQKKRDAEKLKSHATDEADVTQDLIRDRLKDLEEQKKRDAQKLKSHATDEADVTQDLIRDRLKDLEEQKKRDAQKLKCHATDEADVTQDLIRDRVKDLRAKNSQSAVRSREKIVIEGGGLKDRLKRLEEQRQLDAQQGRAITGSDVKYDFVRDRLQQIQELMDDQDAMTIAERESIIVEGGRLADRLEALDRQREKDSAKLISYTTSLSNVTDDLIRERMSWLERQSEQQVVLPEKARDIVSHDLVGERLSWLQESARKASELPDKERLEATRDLVKQRQAWLDEAKMKAAELPKKEKIEVTQGLLNERIAWLEAEKEKASSLSYTQRVEMTTGLIAERLEWLERQYALDASEDIEMQITFLAEQKANADKMTQDEQMVMTNALLDEKRQDLANQIELTAELSEEQITQVAGLLIDDRQAWLEGTGENPTTEGPSEVDDPVVAESNAEMEEVANSISFWAEQKKMASSMNEAERSEITSFLIQEHITVLEQAAGETTDESVREDIVMQIEFLRDQNENLHEIDHMTMINALIDEKITNLEQKLAELYERVSALCVVS